jgi:hypothetical protein
MAKETILANDAARMIEADMAAQGRDVTTRGARLASWILARLVAGSLERPACGGSLGASILATCTRPTSALHGLEPCAGREAERRILFYPCRAT